MVQSISPPFRPHYPWLQGEQLYADELNAAIANGGHGMRVTDWLTGGQPDGESDNCAELQAALDAAAGVVCSNPSIGITDADRANALGLSPIMFTANDACYMIGSNNGLHIPSNTHIIIEVGATIQTMPGGQGGMGVVQNGTNVLIELYGTIDGNNRAGVPFPNGGIVTYGSGPASDIYVRGGGLGLIKDTNVFPCNFTQTVNSEIEGITVDGSGSSFGYAGNTKTIAAATITGGSYDGTTLTLTTAVPHNLVPGQWFQPMGSGIPIVVFGQYAHYQVALVPNSTTVTAAVSGLGAITITPGGFLNALSGGLDPGGSGNMVITTVQLHGLTPGSVFNLASTYNNTAPQFQCVGEFTALAGTGGNTLIYFAPRDYQGTFTSGILGITTPSVNVGIVNCTVRNIRDLGVGFYGGVHGGYIRGCDVSQCQGATVFVFGDQSQRGVNHDCEIADNDIHDNNSVGVYVGSNIFGLKHQDTLVTNNRVYGNGGGAVAVNYADGVLIEGNYFHENIYHAPSPASPFQMGAEITLTQTATRVKISDNTIYNPMLGCTDGKGYGIAFDNTATYLEISNNRIGDYQVTKSMTAALGGTWGANGLSDGNYYGPRIATLGLFPADQSFYAGSRQGINYDMVTGAVSGTTPPQPVQALVAGTLPAHPVAGGVPGRGLTVGWNNANAAGTNRPGLGEVDFFVGDGGQIGGFNFFQSQAAKISGTYTSTTGAVVLTVNMPHTLMPGNQFQLKAVVGAAVGTGTDWLLLNGTWTATAGTNGALVSAAGNSYDNGTGIVTLTTSAPHGITAGTSFVLLGVTGTSSNPPPAVSLVNNLNGTWLATSVTTTTITFTTLAALGVATITGGQVSGSTLTFTGPTGLDITAITAGILAVGGGAEELGSVNTSVGVGGSLLANDGYGNLRLGGALVHGALQASGSISSGGTVTIQPNTSFVLVQNAASIAAATVVLPVSTGEAYPVPAVGGGNELEINFANPVGALTVVAGGTLTVSGAPTAIAAAHTSISFLQAGNTWLRRVMT